MFNKMYNTLNTTYDLFSDSDIYWLVTGDVTARSSMVKIPQLSGAY